MHPAKRLNRLCESPHHPRLSDEVRARGSITAEPMWTQSYAEKISRRSPLFSFAQKL